MTDAMTRRTFAGSIGAAVAAGATMQARAAEAPPQPAAAKRWQNGTSPWPLCLDTATIRPASLEEKIRIAAKAGFDAIEPWEGELHEYEEKGGILADLGKRIRDAGLFVPSVIGLWNAIPATREEFDKSLVDSRRRMRQADAAGGRGWGRAHPGGAAAGEAVAGVRSEVGRRPLPRTARDRAE